MSVPTNVTFDDTQASFSWAGSWTVSRADDDLCEECSSSKIDATQLFNGTSHNALASNSTGSCTFTGTAIYVYGVDAPNSGTMRFTVDDDHNTTEAHVYDGDSVIYDATLYSVAGLSNGQHTLNFEMTTAPEDGGMSCIDYAVVTREDIASVSSISSDDNNGHHSTASSSSYAFSATTESLTTAPTPTSSCADNSSCSVSGGVSEQGPSQLLVPPETIIGAVVGSVLGLFMIIGGLLFLWYKRRKKSMLRQPLPFVGLLTILSLLRIKCLRKRHWLAHSLVKSRMRSYLTMCP
ncbi:uncharacterized protein STEHIDRAFT_122216 [Stereum hirsutum FP-91666 SS1]|uniref:uncharacterized protein n=1 Tax=Stereum hirsutum (strain FP-91666) TaxID=721885 RepID=UPI0004449CCD|nr:uncharacterized protein STEHIDRAFT_122216 [Stereum hirsutum FP-91666 SS1]EIM86298.1 hypothetical protein STEHIDRAFT_122216 [Stereum hirsutum FP-91666 SS1]